MSNTDYRPTKWALIGAGYFGEYYAQILNSLPNVELVSVYSHAERGTPEYGVYKGLSLTEFAKKYNIRKKSMDLHEVIEDNEVDAVAVVTDERYHYEPTMTAIRAGKAIIVEKPIATDLNQANKMIEAADKAGVFFVVCHILPFNTHYYKVKEEIEKGAVGDIVAMYARRNAASFWGDTVQKRSSAIIDEMVHDLDCMLWFTEFTKQTGWKVKKVYAQSNNVRGFQYPDVNWAMLTFENGCIVNLEANWFLPNNSPYMIDSQMMIHGTDGIVYLVLDDQGVRVNDKNGWRCPDIAWWPEQFGTIYGSLRDEIVYLANCITLGKKPAEGVGDPKRANYAARVCLAAQKSAETGKIIEL